MKQVQHLLEVHQPDTAQHHQPDLASASVQDNSASGSEGVANSVDKAADLKQVLEQKQAEKFPGFPSNGTFATHNPQLR